MFNNEMSKQDVSTSLKHLISLFIKQNFTESDTFSKIG